MAPREMPYGVILPGARTDEVRDDLVADELETGRAVAVVLVGHLMA